MRYAAYDECHGVPHVVVDGSAQAGTLLTLSHWPHSGTPAPLRDDLSAQIAFRYLERPEHRVAADLVTNNHFDQDGLAVVYTLVDPAGALARRDLVVDVARAGDFSCFQHRSAARIAFTIPALAAETEGDPYPVLLERLPELLDHPDRFHAHWEQEDAHLARSEAAVVDGTVIVEEIPDVDLAIVTVPPSWAERQVQRFGGAVAQAVHPMAVHNATDRLRLCYLHGRRYEVQYRYESWVQYVSRRPMPRVDLSGLAVALTRQEADGAAWVFDGSGALMPSLRLQGAAESAIAPEPFVAAVAEALRTGQGSWDPYD